MSRQPKPLRVLMLLQNSNYSDDTRVRQEAAALRGAGCEVTVVCPRGHGEPRFLIFDHGVRAYQFSKYYLGSGYLGYLFEYAWSLAMMFGLSLVASWRHGFDVVHAHNPPDFLVAIGLFYKLFGKRFVYDHHDLAPEMYPLRFTGGGNPLMLRGLLFFERLSCRWADSVITVNESHKRLLCNRAGIAPSRVTVVRNGPGDECFADSEPHPALRDRNKAIIGYMGTMGPLDGVDCLLRSLAALRDSLHVDGWLCVLVGDGEVFAELQKLAADLGLADHTVFIGRVPYREVASYIQAMDVCTIPDSANSYTTHCTLVKTMEYMAQRKPIVAFDLIETRYSAADAAIYVPENDQLAFARELAALLADPERRAQMGLAGRERVESRLAWRHSVPHLLSVYSKLASPVAALNAESTVGRPADLEFTRQGATE